MSSKDFHQNVHFDLQLVTYFALFVLGKFNIILFSQKFSRKFYLFRILLRKCENETFRFNRYA
jgi:hypothetical protein